MENHVSSWLLTDDEHLWKFLSTCGAEFLDKKERGISRANLERFTRLCSMKISVKMMLCLVQFVQAANTKLKRHGNSQEKQKNSQFNTCHR